MLTNLTVFTPNQEYGPENDPKTDSVRPFNTQLFLEEYDTFNYSDRCDTFNYCYRCDMLIVTECVNKCTCIYEGKLPQNQYCSHCDEKYNNAEERCDCFCKDCKEINAPEDNQLCACEREAEEEFQRSFECKGYNYCYKCCAVIKTNINSTNLCTCIADGILPQNVECIDCLEIYNEGDVPCECIREMMYNDMMKTMGPSFKKWILKKA
jgi:hypothetical protein